MGGGWGRGCNYAIVFGRRTADFVVGVANERSLFVLFTVVLL